MRENIEQHGCCEKAIIGEAMKKIRERKTSKECDKPGCLIPKRLPKVGRCICSDPIWIAIPAGEHIHLTCPVHGDRIFFGPKITYLKEQYKYEGPSPKVTWSKREYVF